MLGKKHILVASLIGTTLLMQACASSVVSDSERDTSGKFDGQYTMEVSKMAGVQFVENWRFNCGGKAYTTWMNVKDGRAFFQPFAPGKPFESNIDSNGRFRLEVPLENEATASGSSSSTIVDGRRKYILTGNLEGGSGRMVFGVKQFAWQGCQTKVKYAKR